MKEALALIEKIIEEHKIINIGARDLEHVANDAAMLVGLDQANQDFIPGQFNQGTGLEKLAESLEKLENGLQMHFEREEKALLNAAERYADRNLVSTLHYLLREHDGIKKRFAHSDKEVAELIGGRLSRNVWEANANDMRAHINHTRKLLEIHAREEEKMLAELRKQLKAGLIKK